MDTAQYAGDDYIVRYQGLEPFAQHLDFLPWERVHTHWVIPDGQEDFEKAALHHHPPGTPLHEDKPLSKRVDEHFRSYGTSVDEISDKFEHTVRHADPWVISYGKGWYSHEAGSAVERLQSRGYSRHTASHIIADLSPQNSWMGTPNHPELGNREEAVRYGTEVSKMVHGVGKYDGHILQVTDNDVAWARERFVNKQGEVTAKLRPGRYDLSGHPSNWDIKPHELAELPVFHTRAGRRERTHAIQTCLGIRHADDFGPKTGAFAHNIENPLDSQRVTIDTHMADASVGGLTKSNKDHYLSNKGGVRNESKSLGEYGGRTGGYGMIGIASATLEATRRLNSQPESWGHGSEPLLPMHTQAIVWTDTLHAKSRPFRNHIETMKTLPWSDTFGYNFGHPLAR